MDTMLAVRRAVPGSTQGNSTSQIPARLKKGIWLAYLACGLDTAAFEAIPELWVCGVGF
jgi:hypothetical protein